MKTPLKKVSLRYISAKWSDYILSSRSINIVVTFKDNSSSAFRAGRAGCINLHIVSTYATHDNWATYKITGWRWWTADLDLIFFSGGGSGCIIAATFPRGKEEVVITVMLVQVSSLDRVLTIRVICNVVRRIGGFCCSRIHRSLKNILPERPKIHVISTVVVEEVCINGIIRRWRAGRNSRRALIGPGPFLHGVRCCQSDCRVLRIGCGHWIIHMVGTIDYLDIRRLLRISNVFFDNPVSSSTVKQIQKEMIAADTYPKIVTTLHVNRWSFGQHGSHSSPWTLDRWGPRIWDLIPRGEAKISTVRFSLDQSRVTDIAVPRATTRIRISTGQGCEDRYGNSTRSIHCYQNGKKNQSFYSIGCGHCRLFIPCSSRTNAKDSWSRRTTIRIRYRS